MLTLLFPVGSGFELEVEAARALGFGVDYVELEYYFGRVFQLRGATKGAFLYRGWIVRPEDYRRLQEAYKGLVTDLEAYRHCYYFPNWYRKLVGLTPRSIWLDENFLDLELVAARVAKEFGGHGLIVKDFIKSRKHEWHDACYIPCASDAEGVKRVVGNFLKRQGEDLVGGLVFREFVDLKRIGVHPKSRIPLANEHRFFVYRGEAFYQAPYWSEGEATPVPGVEVIREVLLKVESPFYAVDVAEKQEGGWVVVELNDGGTAGIPEGGNPKDFYQALKAFCV